MCSVCTIACSQAMLASVAASHLPQPAAPRPSQPAATAGTVCGALVNTSVYLKPTKLLNVALDVLA